ncbi:hypothetical protein [Bradyrhizobium sp.]|jgi:hypothetical protein|uniref:hypothetical protein n=1 Tax=Bradyrhizobium sp. TaxID=376 RepID=UPI003C212197
MPAIFERWVGQATAKSLEPQFNNAVLLKCNASLFHTLANYGPGGGVTGGIEQKPFSGPTTSILAGDEIGPQHKGRSLGHAINNGVGAMTFILRFIYREYCRSCFQHIRYL